MLPEVGRLPGTLTVKPRTAGLASGRVRTLGVCVGVGLAYYAGAQLGLALRLPPSTTSVMWPPNAILTSVLLLSAPERWWMYLLAALPAHLLLELSVGWHGLLVFALFTTNCSEALVAAWGVRRFSDDPTRFDNLHRLGVFLGAAVLAAPFLSSFVDAAFVALFQGEAYWTVWRLRFISNLVTQLVWVPAVVTVVSRGPDWLRRVSLRRAIEAALLGATVLVTAGAVFGESSAQMGAFAGVARYTGVILMPCFIWAAVRFGVAGASLALLTTALFVIGAAVQGRGPFGPLPAALNVLSVQVLQTLLAIPILFLAAVIGEREAVQEALRERLRFEEFLSRLSGAFVHLSSRDMDHAFEEWLERLGLFLGIDRVALLRISHDPRELVVGKAWSAAGVRPLEAGRSCGASPWVLQQVLEKKHVVFSHRDELPPEAHVDRAMLQREGVRASLTLPLVAGNRVLGAVAFVNVTTDNEWSADLRARLRLFAEVFANAYARKETEDAALASQLEAQRSRQELAHFTRVSTMGELASSLAHQLNQPLTAILTNAQAASRFLAVTTPDLDEVRAIVQDIISDEKRAGDVIRRLRELLRKGGGDQLVLDLNALIRDIVDLLRSDAIIRNVRIVLHLNNGDLTVLGDRVELQQVILNLVLNAMDAVCEMPDGDRTVLVRTLHSPQAVSVMVQDAGPGLRPGTEDLVFEPFYTTKPSGMGMGLSIARSIVEAHGGWIRASNRERGATFEVRLPVASQGS